MPERKQKPERRLLTALLVSAALHTPLFHEEIADFTEDTARQTRQTFNKSEKQALLQELQDELTDQEVLDLDLSEFHFKHEELAGGVSPAEVEKAQKRYQEIIDHAKTLQAEGKDFDEVMNYVLSQKNEYQSGESYMTDLLVGDGGNCEAILKYTSSALQDLYPEIANSGALQQETFRSYVNADGEAVPGHFRTVVEDGDELIILEGDKVFRSKVSEHKDITRTEITHTVVEGVLAHENLYSLEDKRVGEFDESMPRPSTEQLVEIFETNSILKYPPSNAIYVTGTTYAPTAPWEHGIALVPLEDPIELEIIPTVPTQLHNVEKSSLELEIPEGPKRAMGFFQGAKITTLKLHIENGDSPTLLFVGGTEINRFTWINPGELQPGSFTGLKVKNLSLVGSTKIDDYTFNGADIGTLTLNANLTPIEENAFKGSGKIGKIEILVKERDEQTQRNAENMMFLANEEQISWELRALNKETNQWETIKKSSH